MKKLILLLAAFLLLSCGARKVNKTTEVVDEKTKAKITNTDNSTAESKSDLNVKKTETTETNKETQEVTKIKTVEPIDNTKPSSYTDEEGHKVDLTNAKLTETVKTSNGKENVKTEQNVDLNKKASEIKKNDVKGTVDIDTEKKTNKKGKAVDQKQYDWTKTIIVISIIIIIACCIIYLLYFRKAKKAIDTVT